jgi:hypothetical protein
MPRILSELPGNPLFEKSRFPGPFRQPPYVLIPMRLQRSKIGGTFFVKNVPPNPLQETSVMCRNRFSLKEMRFRPVLEVLEEGFGEELLTRSASPILP